MPTKQKLGFHAKNQKIWLPCQQNKTCFSKKLGFYATKSGFHAKQTKIGFHATKQNLWLPCHKTKTWLSRHKNRLSCQKPAFMPNKILAFMPSKIRPASHLKNQAFCHKIWLSCLKTTIWQKIFTKWQPFDQIFKQTIPIQFLLMFSSKVNLSEIRGYKKRSAKNVYTWRYQKKRRKSLLQIRRLVRHGLQP